MKRLMVLVAIFVLLFGVISLINLDAEVVTAAPEAGIVGNGTLGSCTEAALISALNGGGEVTFDCGANPVTITLTAERTITADTTIDGGGLITLSGGNTTRLLNLQNGASLTLRNLSVTNGYSAQNGGAIYAERLSALTIEDCTFSDNTGYNGGAVATNGWDGTGVVITVSESVFTGNIATAPAISGGGNGGGAFYMSGHSEMTVSDSTFSGNQSGNGGAIHLLHSNLLATNVDFNANVANNSAGGGGGGAIYMDGTRNLSGEVRINDCTFYHNTTNQLGGAMFSFPEGTGSTHIDFSTFDGNVSNGPGQGGAIYHQSAHGTGALEIDRSLFVNNRSAAEPLDSSSSGGALWLLDAQVTIRNSTFTANDATHSQAASMDADDWRRGFGGAIRTSSTTTIINSTLAGNTAGFVGGAIAGDATVQNTLISSNTGGNPWDIQQNCTDLLTDGGGNLQYPQKTTNNWNDYECLGSQTAIDPLLGTLGDYGGPTLTMPLLDGSPAIDSGVNAACPATDQRGFLRSDGLCDAGVYEVGASSAPILQHISPARIGLDDVSGDLTLTLTGAEFNNNCIVRWNGEARPTTFVDSFHLTAEIPASELVSVGPATVTVYDTGEGAESGGLMFAIVDALSEVWLPMIHR